MLEHYINKYKERTRLSEKEFNRAKNIFVNGINHNIRYFEPYPFFTIKAKGKYLYDIDNNIYTDYWMGHWSLILGHAHEYVIERVKEQANNGTIYGTANKVSLDLAEFINKLIPRAELIRFANTGAEVTMYAVRLARAYTRKRYIIKIDGGWHGFNTDLLNAVNYPFESEGLGLLEEDTKYVKSIPYNDIFAIKGLDSIKDDIACIIVEPFLGGGGSIPGEMDYLKSLEEYAKSNNILFILDEIVTAFRFRLGSMHDMLSLDPDLITLGKIVGGGLPIGALSGKKEIMQLTSPTLPIARRCNIGGGTFSANPLTMVAGLATLEYLKDHLSIYDKLNRLGNLVRSEIDKIMHSNNIRTETTGFGSLFLTHFLNDNIDHIKNARDASLCNTKLQRLYHLALMCYNIFFLPGKLGAISVMHDDEDIKELLRTTEVIAQEYNHLL